MAAPFWNSFQLITVENELLMQSDAPWLSLKRPIPPCNQDEPPCKVMIAVLCMMAAAMVVVMMIGCGTVFCLGLIPFILC